jgi:hypothetical protein
MTARALASIAVLALGAALLPSAAGAQEAPCPQGPPESEIDQYAGGQTGLCPVPGGGGPGGGEGAGDGLPSGVASGQLPFTGLAIVALVVVGSVSLMAGAALRRRREATGEDSSTG